MSSRRSRGPRPSIRAAISACSVSGTSSSTDRAGQLVALGARHQAPRSTSIRTISVAYSGMPSARAAIARAQLVGGARDQRLQQRVDLAFGERLEVEPHVPGGPVAGQLARDQEHEDRSGRRPFVQVGDEIEQARVGPLHVLEDQRDRGVVRHPLDEQPPAGEQVGLVGGGPAVQPDQGGQPRLDEPALELV